MLNFNSLIRDRIKGKVIKNSQINHSVIAKGGLARAGGVKDSEVVE